MLRIEKAEREISVKEYLDGYVEAAEFLEACKACPNYGAVWSCPPYDFDVHQYWGRFQRLRVFARKIYLDGVSSWEEASLLLASVKDDMSRELYELEKTIPESVSLSAGSCSLCSSGCTRSSGAPCRWPERMRYSIESLGGNVGLTCRRLMGFELEWMEEGKLPSYFVLCAGLLMK